MAANALGAQSQSDIYSPTRRAPTPQLRYTGCGLDCQLVEGSYPPQLPIGRICGLNSHGMAVMQAQDGPSRARDCLFGRHPSSSKAAQAERVATRTSPAAAHAVPLQQLVDQALDVSGP